MQELKASDNKYMIKKEESLIEVVALSGYEKGCMCLKSAYFDVFLDQLLIAIQLDTSQYRYATDYILFDRDMNIVEALSETEGVIPRFLFGFYANQLIFCYSRK